MRAEGRAASAPGRAEHSAERRVVDRFLGEMGPLPDAEGRIGELLDEELPLLGGSARDERARRLVSELLGLGPLQDLLEVEEITDVLVNGPGPVWVERGGVMERTDVLVATEEILRAVERLVAPLGLQADRAHPIVDGRLQDGTRVSAVLPPLAVDGPVLAIRRHRSTPMGLDDFGGPSVTRPLEEAVRDGANIIVYGPTGSGKTTLLNALGTKVPAGERVVVIEETAELRLPQDHLVRLETRPGTAAGTGRCDMRDLVRAALRLRPDRIVVGEVRGAEAVDMIWALSTGHRGCMSTLHADGPADVVRRLETMMVLGMGESVPMAALRQQVVAAVDLLVAVRRTTGGSRRVVGLHTLGAEGPKPVEGVDHRHADRRVESG